MMRNIFKIILNQIIHNLNKIILFVGIFIFLGGFITRYLGLHQLLPVPRPDGVVYITTLIGMLLIYVGSFKPTKEMLILANDERHNTIQNASMAVGYLVLIILLVPVFFALIFMGYVNDVVCLSVLGSVSIAFITQLVTAHYLEKKM